VSHDETPSLPLGPLAPSRPPSAAELTRELLPCLTGCEVIGVLEGAGAAIAYVQSLDLMDKNIGDEHVDAIMDLLAPAAALRALYLDGNYIGNEGAEALARHLHEHPQLAELSLSHNEIGNRGAKALARQLGAVRQLVDLQVFANPMWRWYEQRLLRLVQHRC
jgi:Ran GTPase-activating protein (RanGAP) involved in mRNA processing and transport